MKKNYLLYFIIIVFIFLLFIPRIQAEGNIIKNMSFKSVDIREVLRSLAKVDNINLVFDDSVKGKVTINLHNITFNRAFKLITQTHNLAYKWDENTVIVASPARIEKIYGQMETSLQKLNNMKYSTIKPIVKSVFPDLKLQKTKNNSLIIIGKKDDVEEAIKMIKKIDLSSDNFEKDFISIGLNTNNPENLLKNIKNIYPDVKISLDKVSNKLIVYSTRDKIKNIKELVTNLDSREKVTRKVMVQPIDQRLIRRKLLKIYPDLVVKYNKKDNQLMLTGLKNTVSNAINEVDKYYSSRKDIIKILQIDHGNLENIEKVISQLTQEIKVRIDKKRRKIIMSGREAEINRFISIIDKLDIPRKQVIIEAKVEEISRTKLTEMGVSPEQLSKINFITEDENINGVKMSWPKFIKTLEEEGKARTLANPRLMTLNGEEAKMLIGDQVPVEVEKIEDGEPITTINYIDAGITLKFKPWITSENNIILKVSPKVSSLGESLGNNLPTINTREAETKVRLHNGQTFVIGGLIENNVIKSLSKIPILADLPVLGQIFKHEKKNIVETEVLIIVTPRIVNFKNMEEEKERQDRQLYLGERLLKKVKKYQDGDDL